MSVYMISRMTIHDRAEYDKYEARFAEVFAKFEGKMLSVDEDPQVVGGAGYTTDWPVERYMRDAKLLDIGAGTNEIRRMLIGRELIGAAG